MKKESDGNDSHAVTIHGGFVYDVNEVTSIPLCKEALDYSCWSTSTVKNEFVSFCKVTLFVVSPDVNRKMQMTLWLRSKQKRDNSGDGERPKIVRTGTFSLK
jgi:hypothetical protein